MGRLSIMIVLGTLVAVAPTLAGAQTAVPPILGLAQSAAQVARDAGLLGEWAEDCTKPPSLANAYATYAAQIDGRVENRWYSANGVIVQRQLLSIKPSGSNRFDVEISDVAYGSMSSTIEIVGNRKLTVFMALGDKVLVRDYRDVQTGRPVLPDYKCEIDLS